MTRWHETVFISSELSKTKLSLWEHLEVSDRLWAVSPSYIPTLIRPARSPSSLPFLPLFGFLRDSFPLSFAAARQPGHQGCRASHPPTTSTDPRPTSSQNARHLPPPPQPIPTPLIPHPQMTWVFQQIRPEVLIHLAIPMTSPSLVFLCWQPYPKPQPGCRAAPLPPSSATTRLVVESVRDNGALVG